MQVKYFLDCVRAVKLWYELVIRNFFAPLFILSHPFILLLSIFRVQVISHGESFF